MKQQIPQLMIQTEEHQTEEERNSPNSPYRPPHSFNTIPLGSASAKNRGNDGITAGYTKYMIDEQNQQYDYIRGMFTEQQIKETFELLDGNHDGSVTGEDLLFYLEFLGERPSQDELEEMIRLCDYDGSGEVRFEEFRKLASGQSLAPLGQAFPPTKELIEKRTYMNQIMMEKEISEITQKGNITPQMMQELNKNQHFSPRTNNDQAQLFQSINNIAQRKVVRKGLGYNLKVIRSEDGQINQSNKTKQQLTMKEIMTQRKNNANRYVTDKRLDEHMIINMFERFSGLESMSRCGYDEFLSHLDLQENYQAKLLFNAMCEQPIREEYAKNSEEIIFEQSVNLQRCMLTFLGFVNCRRQDKLETAYQIQDIYQNGYITFDELVNVLVYLYCIPDIDSVEVKLLKMTQKKGLKNRKDIIKKEIYMMMINEYGSMFEL